VFEIKDGDSSRKTGADSNSHDLQPDAEMQDLLADLQHSLDEQNTKQSGRKTTDSFLPPMTADSLFTEKPGQDEFLTDQPGAKEEDFLPELSRQQKPASLLAIILLFLLLLTALAQISWINKERLLLLPQVHAAATRLCSYFDCSLPQKQTTVQRFLVVDRALQPTDKQPGAYRLDVLLRNAGPSASTLPALQLSLLDDKQVTIARRTFPPSDYATNAGRQPKQIAAGELLEIQLLILPPEAHFYGFELDFIPIESS